MAIHSWQTALSVTMNAVSGRTLIRTGQSQSMRLHLAIVGYERGIPVGRDMLVFTLMGSNAKRTDGHMSKPTDRYRKDSNRTTFATTARAFDPITWKPLPGTKILCVVSYRLLRESNKSRRRIVLMGIHTTKKIPITAQTSQVESARLAYESAIALVQKGKRNVDSELLVPLLVYVAAAGYVTKLIIDMIRRSVVLASWASPVLACGIGVAVVFLIMLVNAVPLTTQALATAILAGVLSGAASVAGTDLARRGDTSQAIMREEQKEDARGASTFDG